MNNDIIPPYKVNVCVDIEDQCEISVHEMEKCSENLAMPFDLRPLNSLIKVSLLRTRCTWGNYHKIAYAL